MPGFPHHSKWAGGLGGDNKGMWIFIAVVCGIAILLMLLVGCTPSISTGVDDRCADSKDTQYACWLAQEAVGPRGT